MEMTVESLIEALEQVRDRKAVVRVKVTHDLDCPLVEQGPIVGIIKKKKGLVLLDCSDDCSHGFGEK